MRKPIKITFKSSAVDDRIAFYKNHRANSKIVKRNIVLNYLTFPLILSILILIDIVRGEFKFGLVILLIIFSIIWMLYLKFIKFNLNRSSVRKNLKKALTEGNHRSLNEETVMIFTDKNFIYEHEGCEAKTNLETVTKVSIEDDYLFIYITPVSAYIIPKKKVREQKNLKEIEDFLKDKFENK